MLLFSKMTDWVSLNLSVECFRRVTAFHPEIIQEHIPLLLPILRGLAITNDLLYLLLSLFFFIYLNSLFSLPSSLPSSFHSSLPSSLPSSFHSSLPSSLSPLSPSFLPPLPQLMLKI